jgi:hypothetical protein
MQQYSNLAPVMPNSFINNLPMEMRAQVHEVINTLNTQRDTTLKLKGSLTRDFRHKVFS